MSEGSNLRFLYRDKYGEPHFAVNNKRKPIKVKKSKIGARAHRRRKARTSIDTRDMSGQNYFNYIVEER